MRPVLVYACETWAVRASDAHSLGVFERWCLRRILNISWQERVSNVELYRRCPGLPDLCTYLQRRRLQWFGHILRKLPTDLCRVVINPTRPSGWKYRLGGQLKTWLSTIKSDVDCMGLAAVYGLRRWKNNWIELCEQLATDRRQWSAAIRDIHIADSSVPRR